MGILGILRSWNEWQYVGPIPIWENQSKINSYTDFSTPPPQNFFNSFDGQDTKSGIGISTFLLNYTNWQNEETNYFSSSCPIKCHEQDKKKERWRNSIVRHIKYLPETKISFWVQNIWVKLVMGTISHQF